MQRIEGGFDLLGLPTGVVDLKDAFLEVEAAFDAAQHFITCAEHAGEQIEFLSEQFQHALVGLVAGVEEVDDHHVVTLTVAVATANALLDTLRIPRQVIVNYECTELQVHTFSCSFSRDHNLSAGAVVLPKMINQGSATINLRRASNSVCSLVLFQPTLIDGSGILMIVSSAEQHQLACIAVLGKKSMQVLLRAL